MLGVPSIASQVAVLTVGAPPGPAAAADPFQFGIAVSIAPPSEKREEPMTRCTKALEYFWSGARLQKVQVDGGWQPGWGAA